MKKSVLTSAALLALAAASYAQIIQQVGEQQFARQNQAGPNQTGLIQQIQGISNNLNYGNYAISFQGTPQNTGSNSLSITQNNGSQGNRAGISQNGGPALLATIAQNGGTDGLSGGATSLSATQGARGEDGNFAGILQTGSNMTASITENNNSRRNSAEIYQNGSGSAINPMTVRITQSNNSVSNSAFVFQGFTGQNILGTPVNGAVALINQGKDVAGDVSAGPVAEAIRNTAVITQTASNVAGFIYQGGVTGGGQAGRASGSGGVINQAAINTSATIFQGISSGESVDSRAVINQIGVNTVAQIIQGQGADGSDNASTASISQIGAGSTSAPLAYIQQGADANSDGDQAIITQTASNVDGFVLISQGSGAGGSYSNNDRATATQGGVTNFATINQNATDGGVTGQSNGRNNTASLTQTTGVVSSFAAIDQGFINFLTAPGSVLQANRNTAIINQTAGANLRARISQGLLGTPLDGQGKLFVLPPALVGDAVVFRGIITNDNTASISQVGGDNHLANIFQTGRFNQAAITQSNGNGSRALVVQTSNSERAQAIVNQMAPGGVNNQATILQFAGSNADGVGSFGNQAIISQTVGSNNIVFLQQGRQTLIAGQPASSNDNFAQVTQNGSSNQARFLQVGNNNFINLTQNGQNNRLLDAGLTPNSFGSQIGYGNRLSLTQNGGTVGLVFGYSQVGNNNTQIVVQNPNP